MGALYNIKSALCDIKSALSEIGSALRISDGTLCDVGTTLFDMRNEIWVRMIIFLCNMEAL